MKGQQGYTLVEVLVGVLVGLLVLFAVADLEIAAWRQRRVDEARFTQQAEAALATDSIAAEAREASAFVLAGEQQVTLHLPDGPVTYRFDPQEGGQIRSADRVLARSVSSATFALEDGGRTLLIRVQMADGYLVTTRATRRGGS